MNAGRELDALIAEKVMGWTRAGAQYHIRPSHRPSKDFPGNILNDFDGKGPHDFLFPDKHDDTLRMAFCGCESTIDVPSYSTDIAAAWEVVEKLGNWHGFDFMILLDTSNSGKWEAGWYEMGWDGYERRCAESADTAPLAICLAALKAVGN